MCSNPECTISYVLREYDLVCSRNYGSSPKNRIGLYRVQDENGTIGSWGYVPFYYYNGWDLLRTSGIATGTNIDFVHLFKESLLFLPRWGQEQIVVDVYGLLKYILTPIGLKFDSYPEKYILFRDVEDPDYLSGTDCTEGMSDPGCYYKRLIALVSNDDFVSWSYDSVFRCIPDNPYSPFSCVDTEFNYVETLRKPEVAYYPGGQAGIFSIGQNKMVFYIDHEQRIRWLFGKPNEDGMAVHFAYDQDTQLDNWIQNNTQLHTDFGKSNVKPAVACSSECTNGATYQCKLAYVPSNQSGQENNKDGKIFFWNFNVSVDYAIVPPYTFVPYRHTINWDANGPQATAYYSTDLKTSGDLAMWETAGYFYLGFKSVSPEVRTVIFRKPVCDDDMITGWTIFDDNTGWTDDGFTVLENPNGSRALVYTTTETYGPEP